MSTEAAAVPEQTPETPTTPEIRLNRDGSTPKPRGRPPGSGKKAAGKTSQTAFAVPLLDETKAEIAAAVKKAKEKVEAAKAALASAEQECSIVLAYENALSEENLAKQRARLDEAELASAA